MPPNQSLNRFFELVSFITLPCPGLPCTADTFTLSTLQVGVNPQTPNTKGPNHPWRNQQSKARQ